MHLAELPGSAPERVPGGRFAHLARLDITGAFDAVPPDALMRTSRSSEMDGYLVRFIEAVLVPTADTWRGVRE